MVRAFKKNFVWGKGHSSLTIEEMPKCYYKRGEYNRHYRLVIKNKQQKRRQNRKRIQQRWVRVR